MDTINKRPRLPTREPEIMDFAPIELDILGDLGDPFLDDITHDPLQQTTDNLDVDLPLPAEGNPNPYEWAPLQGQPADISEVDHSLGGGADAAANKRRSNSPTESEHSDGHEATRKTRKKKPAKRLRLDKVGRE